MRFVPTAILVALPLAICAPTNTQAITVLYRWEKTANEHGIAAFDKFGTLIGHSCSKALDTGSFANDPISFNLTKHNGAGFITVDGSMHMIHANSQYSNGPTCTRVYNQEMVELECQVAMPGGFQGVPISANDVSCFKRLAEGLRVLDTSHVEDPNYAVDDTIFSPQESEHDAMNPRSNDLVERQCTTSYATDPQKDKDPFQRYLARQLTVPHHCEPHHTCSVSAGDGDSYTVSFDATFNPNQWISAGFHVGKSITTANTYSCDGDPGDVICVWERVAFTKYNAQNVEFINCGGGGSTSRRGAKGSITSPNKGDVGWGTYCVDGTCRDKGSHYWAKEDTHPGGPGSGPPL